MPVYQHAVACCVHVWCAADEQCAVSVVHSLCQTAGVRRLSCKVPNQLQQQVKLLLTHTAWTAAMFCLFLYISFTCLASCPRLLTSPTTPAILQGAAAAAEGAVCRHGAA
jgi:hypothetical protein